MKKGKFTIVVASTVALLALISAGIYYSNARLPQIIGDLSVNRTEIFTDGPAIATLYEKCLEIESMKSRTVCLMEYFREVTMQDGAQTALSRAQELQREGVIKECHSAAHAIGNANFDKFDGDLGKAFSTCSFEEESKWNTCLEGCSHGVMEEYVERNDSLDNLMSSISQICSEVTGPKDPRTTCMHGLGHGLVRHDLSKVTEAANLCRRLTDPVDFAPCLHGVFMENMNNYLSLTEANLRSEISQICEPAIITGDQLNTTICIQEIAYGLMTYTSRDFDKARELCTPLSLGHREECVQYINSTEQEES